MKSTRILMSLAAATLCTGAAHAATLTQWSFENESGMTPPSSATYTYTGIAPEVGTGTAGVYHPTTTTLTSSTYSWGTGNGSSSSFRSKAWTAGDYYQFDVSTASLSSSVGIVFNWDQTTATGAPLGWTLAYSTDGVHYTNLEIYTSPTDMWIGDAVSYKPADTMTADLSAIAGLTGGTLSVRLIANTTGTASALSRVDNVTFSTVAVAATPEPASLGLIGAGAMALLARRRRA